MIDAEATRALRAMRARRFRIARYTAGPRSEFFRGEERFDYISDFWMVSDWFAVREKIREAVDDRARMSEDAQRGPATVLCPAVPRTFDGTGVHWPWEDYTNRRQRRDRRRLKRAVIREAKEAARAAKKAAKKANRKVSRIWLTRPAKKVCADVGKSTNVSVCSAVVKM